ncbi:MAG: hypothetical protein GY835_26325 [bacterium]|nr:hypothetical protein [bacterium]
MPTPIKAAATVINTLNERPLHAALKNRLAQPGDCLEAPLEGYIIDILRDDLLIEIQTRSFSSLKRKLLDLTRRHRVLLVHPIALEKWIVKGEDSRRRSPRRGRIEEIFEELVSFPALLAEPNFTLEVLLTREEEKRRYEAGRARRRKGWVIEERRLVDVVESRIFSTPEDMVALLPAGLPEPFTTADLAAASGLPRWRAQKMAYCLREMGAIRQMGKIGRSLAYSR